MEYDLIVIGGGAGGLTVASGASQLGAKVALIDKDELGGDCLFSGCVPSKSLIKSAKVAHTIKNASKYGFKDSKPEFEFKDVIQRIQDIIKTISIHDDPERFRGYGADVIFGEAKFKDKHTISISLNPKLKEIQQENILEKGNSFEITGKQIVIATGSSPFVPPINGLKETGYITNEEVFHLEEQPKSMLVIGGGAIGCELAQSFSRLGTKVYISIRGDRIMKNDDPDISDIMMKVFEKEGIEILKNSSTTKIKSKDGKKVIHYTQNETEKTLEVDEILVATGRKPNINLDLENAGINFDKKGIPTNKKLRTNQKHIYAVGDVNGKFGFTHTAGYEGGIVVSNAIVKFPRKANYNKIPWCTFTDPEVASCGHNETTAKANNISYKVYEHKFDLQDRAVAESQNKGKIKILTTGKSDKIIGAQIIGPNAGELVHEFIIAMEKGSTVSTIASAIHIYPTLADINKAVSGKPLSKKLFNNKVRKLLKFLFRYRGKTEQ